VKDQRRSGIAAGVLLVLFGVALLALQLVPGLRAWLDISFGWPSIIIGIGAVMLFAGLFTWQPGLVNGGCIVAGIGGILYWQNATNTWASWAYAWTLIPAFAGVGMILAGVMQGDFLRSLRMGLWQILTSAVLFLIFAAFLGGPNLLGVYWPVLIIGLGIILLFQSLLRKR
jgi:hypothetical protein